MFGFKWPLFSSSSNTDENQSTASSSSTSAKYLVVKKCPIGVSDIDLFKHFKKLARHSLESVQCVQLQQHRDALLRFALSEDADQIVQQKIHNVEVLDENFDPVNYGVEVTRPNVKELKVYQALLAKQKVQLEDSQEAGSERVLESGTDSGTSNKSEMEEPNLPENVHQLPIDVMTSTPADASNFDTGVFISLDNRDVDAASVKSEPVAASLKQEFVAPVGAEEPVDVTPWNDNDVAFKDLIFSQPGLLSDSQAVAESGAQGEPSYMEIKPIEVDSSDDEVDITDPSDRNQPASDSDSDVEITGIEPAPPAVKIGQKRTITGVKLEDDADAKKRKVKVSDFKSKSASPVEGHNVASASSSSSASAHNVTSASASTSHSLNDLELAENDVNVSAIELRGFKDVSKDYVRLFFENQKHSGGGEISQFEWDELGGRAIIIYESAEVVKRVLKKGAFVLGTGTVTASALDPTWPLDWSSHSVKVEGWPGPVHEDVIRRLFENRMLTGGDQTEHVDVLEDDSRFVVIVTYASGNVARRVELKEDIRFAESPLTVTLLPPAPPPHLVSEPLDHCRLIFLNLPFSAYRDDIVAFLADCAGANVTEVIYGQTKGVAMVAFDLKPRYNAVKLRCLKRPFHGHMVSVQRVAQPDTIQVHGFTVASDTHDFLSLYFENSRRSGGSEIISCEIDADQRCALIRFRDREAVQSVVSRSHNVQSRQLQVSAYYPYLGMQPSPVVSSSPLAWLPSHIVVNCPSAHILTFLLSSSKHRKFMEEKLLEYQCKVEWPNSGDGGCVMLKNDAKTTLDLAVSKHAEKWEKNARDAWDTLMAKFAHESLCLMEATWSKFLGHIGNVNFDGVRVSFDHAKFVINCAGEKHFVLEQIKKLSKIKSAVENEIRNLKEMIMEKVDSIEQYELMLLKTIGFDKFLQERFPGTTVIFPIDGSGAVLIKGLPADVLKVKAEFHTQLKSIHKKFISVSTDACRLLEREAVKRHLAQKFNQKVVMTLDALDCKATVYGMNATDVQQGLHAVTECAFERKLKIENHWQSLVTNGKLKEWMDSVVERGNELILFEMDPRKAHLLLISEKVMTDEIIENLQLFVQEYAIVTRHCGPYASNLVEFVQRFMRPALSSIERDIGCCVKIDLELNERQFIVSGNSTGIGLAEKRLDALMESIAYDYYACEGPQAKPAAKYFADKGRLFLEALGNRHHVLIQTEAEVTATVMADEVENVDVVPGLREVLCFDLPSGPRLLVVAGNIAAEQVDVIVSPTNEHLDLTGGVAASIVRAGGEEVRSDVVKQLQNMARLPIGNVIQTPGHGELLCKRIIHVSSPTWQGGRYGEENQLYDAINAVMMEAVRLRAHTVALPAIGAGTHCFPADICATTMVAAVCAYLTVMSDTTGLRELRFVDQNSQIVDQWTKCLQDNGLTARTMQLECGSQPTLARASTHPTGGSSSKAVAEQGSGFQTPSRSSSAAFARADRRGFDSVTRLSESHVEYYAKSGLTVSLRKGLLTDIKADVLVNIVSPNLNLNQTHVSQLVLAAAGPGLQDECRTKLPPSGVVPYGQFVDTSASKLLTCRRICHGVLDSWNSASGSAEEHVTSLVKACLTYCHANKMRSIIFPILGTGKLLFPPHLSARLMLAELLRDRTLVSEVSVVMFPAETEAWRAFQDEAQSWLDNEDNVTLSGNQESRASGREQSQPNRSQSMTQGVIGQPIAQGVSGRPIAQGVSSTANPVVPDMERVKIEQLADLKGASVTSGGVHAGRQPTKSSSPAAAASCAVSPGKRRLSSDSAKNDEIRLNCLKITVVQSDLTSEMVDAIVNSTNKNLDLSKGAVAQAILKKGGVALQDECKRLAPITNIAMTTGGNLPCRYVIHLVAPSTVNDFRGLITLVLHRAEDEQLASVAFPALGTGQLTLGADVVAPLMFDTVRNFDATVRPKYLKRVIFSIFDPTIYAAFCNELSRQMLESETPPLKRAEEDDDENMTSRRSSTETMSSEVAAHVPGVLVKRLLITAESDAIITTVKVEIDEMLTNEMLQQVVDEPEKLELLRQFNTPVAELLEQYDVDVALSANRLVITGLARDVTRAVGHIYNVISTLQNHAHTEQQANRVSKLVQWSFWDEKNKSFQPYPPLINYVIEQGYERRQDLVNYTPLDGRPCLVNFARMEEVCTSDAVSANPVKIRRQEIQHAEVLPPNWQAMQPTEPFVLVSLDPKSDEYKVVLGALYGTHGLGFVANVQSIERVQNPELYQQFMAKKRRMDLINGENFTNERWLWHGTAPDKVRKIYSQGFNRSFAGEHATRLGHGVYFALSASYSAHLTYSPPDMHGNKHMFYCRVLTGHCTQGQPEMKVLPTRDSAREILYDSAVDKSNDPQIYVIFHDTQAYPAYLIKFKSV